MIKYWFDWARLKLVRWYVGRQTKSMFKDYYKFLDSLDKWEASSEAKNMLATMSIFMPLIMLRFYIFLNLLEPVKNEKSTK